MNAMDGQLFVFTITRLWSRKSFLHLRVWRVSCGCRAKAHLRHVRGPWLRNLRKPLRTCHLQLRRLRKRTPPGRQEHSGRHCPRRWCGLGALPGLLQLVGGDPVEMVLRLLLAPDAAAPRLQAVRLADEAD